MPRRPKETSFVQPSTRVSTVWTPTLIKAAFLQAEGGHIRTLAELCDNILADDRVSTVFETRIGGLLGLPLSFEASGDGRRKNRAVRALEAEEDWWAAFPEYELTQFLTWGRLLGVSFAQIHPTEHEGRFVPRIEFWHPRNTRYDWHTRQWFARVDSGVHEVPIVPGDGQWMAYMPEGEFRPWANGKWRGLARWWLLKSYAQDDAGRASEKSGTTVVTASEDSDDELRQEIAADMFEAARDAVIALPKGFDAKVLDSKSSIEQNQGKIVDMANTAIAVAVLGQNLTTETSGGSFAAAKVHARVEIQRIRSDAETAATVLHDQALEWWAEFNFGSKSLAPWPVWQTDPPTDQKERADVLKTLSEALSGFQALGLQPDLEQIKTEFGVDLKAAPKPEPPPVQQKPEPKDEGVKDGEVDPEPEARAMRPVAIQLRAADDGSVHNGQDYADRVMRKMVAHGAKELAPTVAKLIAAAQKAESYAEARTLIAEAYGKLAPPTRLAELTDAAMVMAQLGGHLEVDEEATEDA